MTACGRKSAFRLQAKYKICSGYIFCFVQVLLRRGVECSGRWRTAATIGAEGTGEPQPWDLQPIFQAFSVIWPLPFFLSQVSFKKGGWGTWRSLPRVPRRGRLSWFNCGLRRCSREIWGLLPVVYNSSGPVYTGNYSEIAILVVQIHTQQKSAFTFKSGWALMLYYLCKGNNWCEISKEK